MKKNRETLFIFTLLIITLCLTPCFLISVNAEFGNIGGQTSDTSGGGSGGGGGNRVSDDPCLNFASGYSEHNGKVGVRISLRYLDYNARTSTRIGKEIYVIPSNIAAIPSDPYSVYRTRYREGDMRGINNDPNSKLNTQHDDWFGKSIVYPNKIYQSLLGSSNSTIEQKKEKLQPWLQSMGVMNAKGEITSRTLKEKLENNCAYDKDNSNNCYQKSGVRLVVENAIFTGSYNNRTCTGYTRMYTTFSEMYEHGRIKNAETYGYGNTYFGYGNLLNAAQSDAFYEKATSCNSTNTLNQRSTCGYNFYDISSILKNNYNYSIDAACEDCESDSEKGSFMIQDISNWDAIKASTEVEKEEKPNIYGYYHKGDGVYCREEYKVEFHNASNKTFSDENGVFTAQKGRYFTVNIKTNPNTDGMPDFGPIRITKTRQCVGGDQAREFLNKNGVGSMGTIKLSYSEDEVKKYSLENQKLLADADRTTTSDVTKSGDVYSKTTIVDYELSADDPEFGHVYRYLKKGDGTAESGKDKLGDNHYTDLKISTLPISFENDKGGKIALTYELPKENAQTGSKIGKAFENKNYFENEDDSENIYKKYADSHERTAEIENSSCAKMYSYGSSKFTRCVEERKNDSTTDTCRNLAKNGNTQNGYVCPFKTDDSDIPKNKCEVKNGKYYMQGVEVTKEVYEDACTCKKLGFGSYLRNIEHNGEWTSDYATYLADCPCPPEERNECPPNTWINGNPCTKCPSGECPMPGGICPLGGDVIYRPIDLINPFPAQQGSGRQTGSNWCGYNLKTNKITCSNDPEQNSVVKTHITNNRGTANYSVYNKKTLYTVEIDANKIKEIRNYNKRNDYNDWKNIECNSTTGICSSKFLRSNVNITTGECKNVSDLKTCAEK